MTTTQSLSELKNIIEQHKQNQQIYKRKLQQLTNTRQKVNEQLQVLQLDYERKIKNLENKLENLKEHNNHLTKQNSIYKSQIQNYQNRLVEKQRLIALLFAQKKEIGIAFSSQKSKSSKESNQFKEQEEEHKIIKKNQNSDNFAFIEPQQSKLKSIDFKKHDKNYHQEIEVGGETQNNDQLQVVQIKQTKKSKTSIPPPPKKRQLTTAINHEDQNNIDVKQETNFKNLTQNKLQENVEIKKKTVVRPPPFKKQINQLVDIDTNIKQKDEELHQIQIEDHTENNQYNENQNQYETNQQIGHQKLQQNQQPEHIYHEHIDRHKKSEEILQENQIQFDANNFFSQLSHQAQNPKQFKKQSIKTQPPIKKNDQSLIKTPKKQVASSHDFFSQLAKNQTEQSNFEAQQSSIDHISRDNSVISNEQSYFGEQNVQNAGDESQIRMKPQPIKMHKKKGKRDNIRPVTSNLFV